jgi:hypothetical protein
MGCNDFIIIPWNKRTKWEDEIYYNQHICLFKIIEKRFNTKRLNNYN